MPMRMFGTPSARTSVLSGCGRSGVAAGVSHAATSSTSASAATPPNAGAVTVSEETAPTTGPNNAPTIAAPNAEPISCPRRPGGDAATSQASAPVHVNALETPWQNRARSSDHSEFARPKATVVAIRIVSPMSTDGFTPSRAVAIPLGTAATSAPAGYMPARTPAPAFDRSSRSA
jgi:hypothetical protein